jgi:hypothetical protein
MPAGSRRFPRFALLVMVLFFGGYPVTPTRGQDLYFRGDANSDSRVNIADAISMMGYLFLQSGPLPCLDAADANDDGRINVSDAIRILFHLFGGKRLPPPFSSPGRDATPDGLDCLKGCSLCVKQSAVNYLGWIRGDMIIQPSGVVVGRRNPDALWVVNDFDSGQDPRLYALEKTGKLKAVFMICVNEDICQPHDDACGSGEMNLIHCDWEGLTIGPGPEGKPTVFIGDIGANRYDTSGDTLFRIHRVIEPDLSSVTGETVLFRDRGDFDTLFFRYPGGVPCDAEILITDPSTGDLFIITEVPEKRMFRYPPPQRPGEVVILEDVGLIRNVYGGTFTSGGDISPDGSLIVIKEWSFVHIFPWISEDPLASFDQKQACRFDLADYLDIVFHAGAIAFDADGGIITFEELCNAPIYKIGF